MKIVKQRNSTNLRKSVECDELSDVEPAPKVKSTYVQFKLNEENLTQTINKIFEMIKNSETQII